MPIDPVLSASAPGTIRREWWQPHPTNPLPPVPLLIAQGNMSGATLLITGGVHGDEYEAPLAITLLFERLTQEVGSLRGRVIGLPVVQGAAWEARQRNSPVDGLNLNRCFATTTSVSPAQKPTRILAEAVFETFVRAADVLVDLHSGGIRLVHLPLIGWYEGDTAAESLARAFAPALYPWIVPNAPGVLSYEAHRIGKTALGAEWMGGGRLDLAGAEAYAAGLRRILTALEMLPKTENPWHDSRPAIRGDYQITESAGLFVPTVALGDSVARGTSLGTLRDTLGNIVATVTAERDGIVAGLPHLPLLASGDRVAYIG